MSILYKPPSINTSADPGLQHITKREQTTVASSIAAAGDAHPTVVFEQINQVITNVVQANPADTVLDLVELNMGGTLLISSSVTATILTGDPINNDRTIQMAAPALMTGRRLIVINRSNSQNLIVQDDLLNTIVVVEGKTSEEILSDGYYWIAVN